MIFGIKTERSVVVDDFVEKFRNPPSISMKLLHNSIYVENRVDWIDEILVFRQKSIGDGFAKIGILSSLAMILLSLFLQSSILMNVGLVLCILCMASISPLVRFFAIALKLVIMGHRKKIILVSNSFLLEKLLFKLEL